MQTSTKTKSQHSPGPWEAEELHDGNYRITYNGAGNWLADVYRDGAPDEQVAADARLIAAAPDLLAVARMVLDTASDTTPPALLAAATAAVAKAEGK